MKLKALQEQLREELMQSNQTYCCYCLEPYQGQLECCGEAHFLSFGDLWEQDQNLLILEAMSEMMP